MNLLRLLVIVAIVWIAWFLIRRALESHRARQREALREQRPEGRMLRCDHCGVHFPEQEAVREGERVYCSPEHRALEHRD